MASAAIVSKLEVLKQLDTDTLVDQRYAKLRAIGKFNLVQGWL